MFERNIFDIYQNFLKKEGNFCGKKCPAIMSYGTAYCVGRVSREDNRPVLHTDDKAFMINSVKSPAEIIKIIPSDCPFFKNQ